MPFQPWFANQSQLLFLNHHLTNKKCGQRTVSCTSCIVASLSSIPIRERTTFIQIYSVKNWQLPFYTMISKIYTYILDKLSFLTRLVDYHSYVLQPLNKVVILLFHMVNSVKNNRILFEVYVKRTRNRNVYRP